MNKLIALSLLSLVCIFSLAQGVYYMQPQMYKGMSYGYGGGYGGGFGGIGNGGFLNFFFMCKYYRGPHRGGGGYLFP